MIKFSHLVSLLALSLISTSLSAAAPGHASPVEVTEVQLRMMAPHIWVNGEVISRSNSQVATEVSGRLVWVAEVGARVKEGAVVARIDATLLRQQLDEQLAIVDREQARLDFLEEEVIRLNSLVKQRNVSQSNLDQTIADKAVARGDLAVAKAKAAQVSEKLKRSEIKAPFDGVVTERLLQLGEWADSGKAVIRLVDVEAKELRAWVTDQALPFVKVGDLLSVKVGDENGKGVVNTIVPVGEQRSRLYELRLSTQQPWVVGQALQLSVPTAKPIEQLSVPRDALVLRRDGTFVFRVAEDGMAQRITVNTGVTTGEFIAVQGELREGDKVVTNGGERLRPGQSVQVIHVSGVAQ